MTWCRTCGAQYDGPTHNCGWVTITKDRYRELVEAEKTPPSSLPVDGREGR